MDVTTIQFIKQTELQGWHRIDQTLGKGGWPYLYKTLNAHEWHKYSLIIDDHKAETIKAKDDKTAIDAFYSLFDLSDCFYCIHKVITQISVIDESM